MTTVVNIKKEKCDAYIGRASRGREGYFGSPIVLGNTCPVCRLVHSSAGDTLPCYSVYFYRRLKYDEAFRAMVLELRGKKLGCFCKPGPCHGDVIKEYLDDTA